MSTGSMRSICCSLLCVALAAAPARSQDLATPVVADAPAAAALLAQATQEAATNPREAVRLLCTVLDDWGGRPVATAGSADLFVAAGLQAERMLFSNPALLEEFRRAEEPAARQLLADGQLDRLAATRLATDAGLEATLRLAQSALARVQYAAAASLLERARQHDGLRGDVRLHHAAMFATALARLGELTAARAVLEGATDAAAQSNAPAGAAAALAAARADVDRAAKARELVPAIDTAEPWREIWHAPIEPGTTLQHVDIGGLNQGGGGGGGPPFVSPRRASVMPAADAWRVFVDDGAGMRAFDRVSGRPLWSHQTSGDKRVAPALCAAAPTGDAVVRFEVHPTTRAHTGGSVLLADAATGQVRWESVLDPAEGQGAAGGFLPVGEPLIVDGRVVVAARRTTPQQEVVSWLVCLDAREPDPPVWASAVASVDALVQTGLRTTDETPVLAGTGVYAATGTGTVARIDPATGALVWLRRFKVPVRDTRTQPEPWELTSPAVALGRVFVLTPDGARMVVLDAATGEEVLTVATGTGTPLGTPRYLVGVPGSSQIVAVGSHVVVFDAAAPATPLWVWPGDQVSPAQMSGRVTAAAGTTAHPACVVVPGAATTQVLAAATGRLLLEIPTTGNARLLPNQLISAGTDDVRSFMSIGEAERAARQRLHADSSADAALALLEFARRVRHGGLAAEAAAEAARRLELDGAAGTVAGGAGADSLVEILLALDEAGVATGNDARVIEETLELAAAATGQRPRAALARAARCARQGQAAEAVRVLCALAMEPGEPRLIEVEGAIATAEAHALVRLAVLGAADDTASRAAGEFATALAAAPETTTCALRTAARCAHAAGAGEGAARVVAALRLRDPALAGRVALELSPHAPRRAPDLGGAPSRIVEFPGRLAPVAAARPVVDQRVLTVQGNHIILRAPPEFEPIWKSDIAAVNPLIIGWGDRVIAWDEPTPGRVAATAVDASSGAVQWRTDDVQALLGPLAAVDDAALVELAGGESAPLSQVLPAVCGGALTLTRRDGAVVALDPADGTTVLWDRPGGGIAVAEYATTECAVIIGGADAAGEGPPRVLALDPQTGAEVLSIELQEGFAPRLAWFRVLPGGVLAIGTEEGVQAHRLAGGDEACPLWAVTANDVQGAASAWVVGRWLVVAGRFGQLVAIDNTTGRVHAAAFHHADMTTEPVRAIETGEGWIAVVRDESAEFYDTEGRFLGRDVAAGDGSIATALATRNALVVLTLLGNTSAAAGAPHFEMDIVQLDARAGGRIIGAPVGLRTIGQRITAARAIDNWVLVSNGVFVQAVDFRQRKPETR